MLRRLHEEKDGAIAAEYAILLVGIAMVVIAIIFTIGSAVSALFSTFFAV